MRLRLTIQRNNLPTVSVLWSVPDTVSAPAYTISRLLEDVNRTLPLEADQWGLEDYVVEVGGFECLHFSSVLQTLKEDDHVNIRPLLTAEVRARALTGRIQISNAGQHLVDGVPFGRPLLRDLPNRPAVDIPPRKRRRIEEDTSAGEEESETVGLITYPSSSGTSRSGKVVQFANLQNEPEDSEEDDGDFIPQEEGEDESMADAESDASSIITSSSDSTSDPSSDSESDLSSDSEDSSSSSEDPDSDAELDTEADMYRNVEKDQNADKDIDVGYSVGPGPSGSDSKDNEQPGSQTLPPEAGVQRASAKENKETKGVKETRRRNKRRRQQVKLSALKERGELPQDATFQDLENYIKSAGETLNPVIPSKTMSAWEGDHVQLDELEGETSSNAATDFGKETSAAGTSHDSNTAVDSPNADAAKETSVAAILPDGSPMVEEAEKRAHVSASNNDAPPAKRRRTAPARDTSVAERMIRHGIKQSLAPKTKEKTPAEPREKTPVDPNFWKSKIKLSAFECWHDGELENDVLATPPFPFKQGWDKEAQAEMAKLNEKKGRGGGGGGGLHKRSAWGSKWDGLMGGV